MSSEWWEPSNPDAINPVPWLHPAAVLYLESLLTPDMTVLEHGCGGSTLWFADKVSRVIATDSDNDWVKKTIQATKDKKNVTVYYQNKFIVGDKVDLLLIDGFNQDRPLWMSNAQVFVKPGGIIVLDNAERPHYVDGREHLMTFCHMPCRIGAYTDYGKYVVTEFYRVKGGVNWI